MHFYRKIVLKLKKVYSLVTKYRKFDSYEVNESGKERLQTEWGHNMRELTLVWENYTKLTVDRQKSTVGRPRKALGTQEKENVELSKKSGMLQ